LDTGNVQIDHKYLGQPGDLCVSESFNYNTMLEAWKLWAKECNADGTPSIVQLNHAGRQSPAGAGKKSLFEKSIAPSAIPLELGKGLLPRFLSSLVFGTPREMTTKDIRKVVQQFANAARLASDAGFAGIEIHAAHGYLLSQFLSTHSNHRTDDYGGSPSKRARIIVDVIHAIRSVVPANFCIGLKLNSVDHQSEEELKGCIEQLQLITKAGIDFLEISGGSYEDRQLVGERHHTSDRTEQREAFFLDFAEAIRHEFPGLPLMVTGGFRTRKAMSEAIENKACDVIGLARPAVLRPDIPKALILNPKVEQVDLSGEMPTVPVPWFIRLTGVRVLGAGAQTAWYTARLQKIGLSQG
jgi:2,4-dienoyl-CoA reductase-like NADH-dependent reductase (Old Yellow Enzyme family)